MIWGRRKNPEIKQTQSLVSLAAKLGVERRLNARVRYPLTGKVCKLPEIYFNDHPLQVKDISVGGCCVLDPDEHLGPAIGHDFNLQLHWATVVEIVKVRIVSRVDHKRHIQFLELSSRRKNQIEKSIAFGVRALNMTRHANSSELGPTMQAVELWSSVHCDSLILENDLHRLAQIFVNNGQFTVFRDAWPNKSQVGRCSRNELEQLILFLANIPSPSPLVTELLRVMEAQLEAGGA